MTSAIYTATVPSFTAALTSLAAILAKAADHPQAATLPDERLAPDMFPLSWQVQLACFHATSGTARLTGAALPGGRPAFIEADLATLQAHIAATLETLHALKPEDFTGAETRHISMPLMPPTSLEIDGTNFLHLWLLPNFYFHHVTAYDILRHNGLAIGKRDFLSQLGPFMKQTA